jgi:hypothetical protein
MTTLMPHTKKSQARRLTVEISPLPPAGIICAVRIDSWWMCGRRPGCANKRASQRAPASCLSELLLLLLPRCGEEPRVNLVFLSQVPSPLCSPMAGPVLTRAEGQQEVRPSTRTPRYQPPWLAVWSVRCRDRAQSASLFAYIAPLAEAVCALRRIPAARSSPEA